MIRKKLLAFIAFWQCVHPPSTSVSRRATDQLRIPTIRWRPGTSLGFGSVPGLTWRGHSFRGRSLRGHACSTSIETLVQATLVELDDALQDYEL